MTPRILLNKFNLNTCGLVLLLAFSVFSSCANKEKPGPPGPSSIMGQATPVYLPHGGGEIRLKDYFLTVSGIDSIGSNEAFTAELSADKSSLRLTPGPLMERVENLRVWISNRPNDIPVIKSEQDTLQIIFRPELKTENASLKGEFTNWQVLPMTPVENGFEYTTLTNPGSYEYVLVINGKEMPDPGNPNTADNGMGGTNSVVTVGTKSEKPFVKTDKILEDGFTLTTSQPLTEVLVYIEDILAVSKRTDSGELKIKFPQPYEGRSYARVYAYNDNGLANDLLIPLQDGKVIADPSLLDRQDFHTQIMYFLMVDRFKDGDPSNTKAVASDEILPIANYMGGDLQGVVDKLDEGYFEMLGVNTIWLSPITQNPEGAYGLWKDPYTKFSGYHGYWPVSNTKIDYRFGDEQIFRTLIDKAHSDEMNVVLDYVANHVHEEHPVYQQNKDWATDLYLPDGRLNTELWDEQRLTTWFDTFLPTLDFSKPEVVEKMTDSAAYWVTNYELDGFRHDATKHIQLEFWRTLTEKVKQRVERPVYQIGETYGSYELIRSYINTGMLDAQFDFNLYDASVAAFARPESSFADLAGSLEKSLKYFGSNHLMGNITGNQDRARFISYASGDVRFDEDAKVAGWTRDIVISDSTAYKNLEMLHAFNLSIPGVPCIYYGDEYGSPGGNDPDNRRMARFDDLAPQELALREKVSELTRKRRNSMALLFGTTEILQADENQLIIRRSYFDDVVTIVFNKGNEEMNYNGKRIAPLSYSFL